MTLHRSEKARDELASKSRVLSLRERSALFLADGQRTHQDVQVLIQDDGSILAKLVDAGYLLVDEASTGQAYPAREPQHEVPIIKLSLDQDQETEPSAAQSAKVADNFEGKRSLAATRMYLFDMCERMFVRKLPAVAHHYRDQLREARDRESMMLIAHNMILSVEKLAGPERADGLKERIAMLLPSEQ